MEQLTDFLGFSFLALFFGLDLRLQNSTPWEAARPGIRQGVASENPFFFGVVFTYRDRDI